MTDTQVPENAALPAPRPTPLTQPFWDAVKNGGLAFLRCQACGEAFLPAREECPNCLSPELAWTPASGRAKLISWVVYHRAFHPAFAARTPYTVAVVELEEGPRLISNISDAPDPEALVIDQALMLRVEQDGGVAVPRFVPASAP